MCRGTEDDAINIKSATRKELIEWIDKQSTKLSEAGVETLTWQSNPIYVFLDWFIEFLRGGRDNDGYGGTALGQLNVI